MKKNEWKGFLKGVISTTLVLGMVAPTFGASSVLQQIYVDRKPIKIMLEGRDRTPPSNTPAIVWNGSTYVPLRYLGELMGKEVNWDGNTRTISIDSPVTSNQPVTANALTVINDPMTTGALDSRWNNQGSIQGDGPNGIKISGDGLVILENVLPNSKCNYTVEFEACFGEGYGLGDKHALFKVYLGKYGDEFTNKFSLYDYGAYYKKDEGTRESEIANFSPGLDREIYHKVLLNINNNQCEIFIDGNFTTSHKLEGEGEVSAFAFAKGEAPFYSYTGYYVRNFKLY